MNTTGMMELSVENEIHFRKRNFADIAQIYNTGIVAKSCMMHVS